MERFANLLLFVLALPLGLILVLSSGCDRAQSPEARLEDAAETFNEARETTREKHQDVEELRDEIAQQQTDVDTAERELAKARQELQGAEERLQRARARLNTRATDIALFRSIQKSLLEEEELRDSAIPVLVDARVVTLRGIASSEEAQQRAIEVAKNAPGVTRVVDQIAVQASERAEDDRGTAAGDTPDEAGAQR